jgi:fumarate hydratase subunit alpha
MRIILASAVTEAVKNLCIRANCFLPADLRRALELSCAQEDWPPAAQLLGDIQENYRRAQRLALPICQDTGVACVFVTIGQQVFVEGDLRGAIDEGVRQGYAEGYLRRSVVSDPLARKNTGDNTPAFITFDIVEGDGLSITVAPKGAGSENMSRLQMLNPSDGVDGLRAFVLDTVRAAGANPCPPVVVGVGVGGTFDGVALLAKRALLRPVDARHPDPCYAALEDELLAEINALGIGPQGFGGRTTALGVNIEAAATHIAQLPCAVNLGCHVTRRQTAVL